MPFCWNSEQLWRCLSRLTEVVCHEEGFSGGAERDLGTLSSLLRKSQAQRRGHGPASCLPVILGGLNNGYVPLGS